MILYSPVAVAHVTSPYGPRDIDYGSKDHKGIDLRAPVGTPIHAAAAGKVLVARDVGSGGLWIRIDHGNGYMTAYGHLSHLGVAKGDHVSAGEQIALSGNTGGVDPHLHFVVYEGGKKVDPASRVTWTMPIRTTAPPPPSLVEKVFDPRGGVLPTLLVTSVLAAAGAGWRLRQIRK